VTAFCFTQRYGSLKSPASKCAEVAPNTTVIALAASVRPRTPVIRCVCATRLKMIAHQNKTQNRRLKPLRRFAQQFHKRTRSCWSEKSPSGPCPCAEISEAKPVGVWAGLSDWFQQANDLDCRRTSRRRKAFRCARWCRADCVFGIGKSDLCRPTDWTNLKRRCVDYEGERTLEIQLWRARWSARCIFRISKSREVTGADAV